MILDLPNAISIASSGSSVRMWFATYQPTIIRAYTSRTNATYAQPDQVRTYVMSAMRRPSTTDSWGRDQMT
ncbi:hypothetical protein LRE75_30845 [Streptomyces sp. 372A]